MKARRVKRPIAAAAIGAGAIGGVITALYLVRRRIGTLRFARGAAALQLVARGGLRYASSAPRVFAAAGENRQQLRTDLALQTAEDVAITLGAMKGVMMKIGQMASYIDDGLAPSVRRTLSRLQDSVPPMSAELAARVVEEELGLPPERAFATWDPEPIAAASIGQVHRAITLDGRAVAVKVQYPGIAETIAADLGNVSLLRRMLRITAPSQDVDALIAELRDRVLEELDYRREADNQRLLADYYDGHPTIHIPGIISELSTRRVVTSDLADGARFAELAGWSQQERDLAAETIYRFVFRSLYEVHAFNGDPHPGNYLFHGGGRVTFLDFGLVKHFSPNELRPLMRVWSTDASLWKRRVSIICQVSFKKETDLELLYANIEPNLGDRDFFIRKAIGWALREYAKTEPEWVLAFVGAHELSPLSRREALKRLGRVW